MHSPAPWQHWSLTLLTVSVLGTFVAGLTLFFDGWIDALALYVACVLVLALLLGHVANQRTPPRTAAFVHEGRADPGGRPSSLMPTRAPGGAWAGTDRTAVTAALGNATPLD